MELPTVNRRQALAGFGTISLGALLAACGDGEVPKAAKPTTNTSGDLAGLFDDSSS